MAFCGEWKPTQKFWDKILDGKNPIQAKRAADGVGVGAAVAIDQYFIGLFNFA